MSDSTLDTVAIRRDGEPNANATRAALHRLVPRGHKTYTPTQLVVRKAAGCRLETVDGARLLDFSSGVLVANLGHGHPEFEARCAELVFDAIESGQFYVWANNEVNFVQRAAGARFAGMSAAPALPRSSQFTDYMRAVFSQDAAQWHKHPREAPGAAQASP